jgi:uncharacterized protein YraI
MKFSFLLFLLLAVLVSGCAGEPVELIQPDQPGIRHEEPGLIGNIPVTAPVEDDTPVVIAPVTVNTPTPVNTAVVEATALNVREGPDTTYPIIASAKQGDRLEVIGQYNTCDWLRVHTISGEIGWVKSGAGYALYQNDCRVVPSGPFRPLNGAIVYERRADYGPGTLTVQNMTLNDGLVVLTDTVGNPQVGVYIRSMDEYTLTGFQDGNYLLYFSYGQAWDGNDNKFMVVEAVKKMDQVLEYYSDDTGYTTWTLSLSSLGDGGGSASASDIPASAFPGIN